MDSKIVNKICHITSVHPRYDTRIFLKECTTINKYNIEVNLIVADGLGDEVKNGINIIDIGKPSGRLNRMFFYSKKAFKAAKKTDSNIYHIHDPELIFLGLKLKRNKSKVIFDAHEDFPKQLKSKPYLNKIVSNTLSIVASIIENYTLKKYNMLIGATPIITEKLKKVNGNVVNINNYPIIGELDKNTDWSLKKREICYIGGISKIRGVKELIKALDYVDDVILNLVGGVSDSFLEELKQESGWRKVRYYGVLSREEVAKVLAASKVGLVTFLSEPNHIEAQPNKMFEYMSARIPVIGSNFPLWIDILETQECGLTVNPKDSKAIAQKIMQILDNNDKSEEMGNKGKEAVKNVYNWNKESVKLMEAYKKLLEEKK